MANPYPKLRSYMAQSGLTFPWAEYHGQGPVGTFDAHLGPDGVAASMVMVIAFADLENAIEQILGYSYRDNLSTTPDGHYWLRRLTPWQHPYYNQLFAKSITKIQGVRMEGNSVTNPTVIFELRGGGIGAGEPQNVGPFTNYHLALLTIQFWRPPYSVRTDADIINHSTGNPQEWYRYVDRNWEIQTQMLCREGTTWTYGASQTFAGGTPTSFVAPFGNKISKIKMRRRWYEIPEQALFNASSVDGTPTGLPYNLLYTQTSVTNPITSFVYPAGSPICGCVNAPIGGTSLVTTGNTTNGSAVITNIPSTAGLAVGFYADGPGVYSTIKSVDSATQVTLNANARATTTGRTLVFEDPTKQMFGAFLGTMLLEAIEITQRPLQLPAVIMRIPTMAGNEPISQVQYDVVFHFEIFDPPRSVTGSPFRGHNLVPYSGDALWYYVNAQSSVSGTSTKTTPYQYVDFSDLFKIL